MNLFHGSRGQVAVRVRDSRLVERGDYLAIVVLLRWCDRGMVLAGVVIMDM